jgi:NADH-quinone oxidoreductase subunit A
MLGWSASMINDYGAVLVQILFAIFFAGAALVTSLVFGKIGKRNEAKDMAYECGMDPVGPTNPRFSVKFYLVAMLFILFDIEIVFLYPWAAVFKEMMGTVGWSIFWSMFLFQAILVVGFVYELKKGALDWRR